VGPASPWLLAPSADGFDSGVCVPGMSEGIPQSEIAEPIVRDRRMQTCAARTVEQVNVLC